MQNNCVNLLEGYSPDMNLKDIEALLYENYYKYKAQGYDVNAIFDQFIDNINNRKLQIQIRLFLILLLITMIKSLYLLATIGVKSDDYYLL